MGTDCPKSDGSTPSFALLALHPSLALEPMHVPGLVLREELLRAVLTCLERRTRSSSPTPGPALDSAGNDKEPGPRDCYCPLHRNAATVPRHTAHLCESPRSHTELPHPPPGSRLQPVHRLPSDRPQALGDAWQSWAKSSLCSPVKHPARPWIG